jgi:glycosyltransferase involved in cell wall biosynthesis
VVRAVADRVRAEQIDFVYLDGSNLGRLAPEIKRVSPRTQVLTFFHNVEARFFLGSLRTEKNLHALGVLAANFRAERDAVRHSDRLITLSERDKAGIRRLYGRAGTDILPLSIEDKLPPAPAEPAVHGARDYCLFVGGAFYANLAGIRWFARNVSPHIGLDTVVVGRGFDALRPELERHSGVKVIGEADDLARWYAGAKVVIAPIFDGSGMKTKTAEALMFGKKVAGTSEPFPATKRSRIRLGGCATAAKNSPRRFARSKQDPSSSLTPSCASSTCATIPMRRPIDAFRASSHK